MCKFLNEWTKRNGSMNDNAMDDGLVVVTEQNTKHSFQTQYINGKKVNKQNKLDVRL